MTEGFLVESPPQALLTTESTKANTTAAATTKQLLSAPEGSAAGEDSEEAAIDLWSRVMRHAQSFSTASPDSSTTQSPESDSTSPSLPDEAQLHVTPDTALASQTTDPTVSGSDIQSTDSTDLESEEGEELDQDSSVGSTTETITTPSTSTDEFSENDAPGLFEESEGSGFIAGICLSRSFWDPPPQCFLFSHKDSKPECFHVPPQTPAPHHQPPQLRLPDVWFLECLQMMKDLDR